MWEVFKTIKKYTKKNGAKANDYVGHAENPPQSNLPEIENPEMRDPIPYVGNPNTEDINPAKNVVNTTIDVGEVKLESSIQRSLSQRSRILHWKFSPDHQSPKTSWPLAREYPG